MQFKPKKMLCRILAVLASLPRPSLAGPVSRGTDPKIEARLEAPVRPEYIYTDVDKREGPVQPEYIYTDVDK